MPRPNDSVPMTAGTVKFVAHRLKVSVDEHSIEFHD